MTQNGLAAIMVICITTVFLCTLGDPDLLDGIISFLMQGTKPTLR